MLLVYQLEVQLVAVDTPVASSSPARPVDTCGLQAGSVRCLEVAMHTVSLTKIERQESSCFKHFSFYFPSKEVEDNGKYFDSPIKE